MIFRNNRSLSKFCNAHLTYFPLVVWTKILVTCIIIDAESDSVSRNQKFEYKFATHTYRPKYLRENMPKMLLSIWLVDNIIIQEYKFRLCVLKSIHLKIYVYSEQSKRCEPIFYKFFRQWKIILSQMKMCYYYYYYRWKYLIKFLQYIPRLTSNLLAELVRMFLLSFKFDILGPIGTMRGWIGLKEASL